MFLALRALRHTKSIKTVKPGKAAAARDAPDAVNLADVKVGNNTSDKAVRVMHGTYCWSDKLSRNRGYLKSRPITVSCIRTELE